MVTRTRIKLRRDTAANWTTNNPVLAEGEVGFEKDTYKFKIGDGTSLWSVLGYFGGEISDATGGAKGIIQLAGALGGTAAAPTALGYADAAALAVAMGLKANASDVTASLVLKANAANAALTGVPTAPTATFGDNSTQISTTGFVQAAVAAVLDAAPGALDTLNELAAALGDDANFATTVTNSLTLKAPLDSPAFTNVPTAPTAAGGTNTTQLATTAFTTAAVAVAQAAADAAANAAAAAQSDIDAIETDVATIETTLATKADYLSPVVFDATTVSPVALANTHLNRMIYVRNRSSELVIQFTSDASSGAGIGAFINVKNESAANVTFTESGGTLITPAGMRNWALPDESVQFVKHGDANTWEAFTPLERLAFRVEIGDETTDLTTGTAKKTFRSPYPIRLQEIRGGLSTASSSGAVTVDVNGQDTVSLLSPKLTIDQGEKTSESAVTAAVLTDTDLADDEEVTVDIDGAGTGAKGLKLTFIGYRYVVAPASGGASEDPDVDDWLTRVTGAGGTVSGATQTAVEDFVASAKASAYWTTFRRLNLFCGDAIASLIPLVNTSGAAADTASGAGVTYAESTGRVFDGASYIDTGYTPTETTGGLSAYLRTAQTDDTIVNVPIGCRAADSTNVFRIGLNSAANGSGAANSNKGIWGSTHVSTNSTGGALPPSAGMWHVSRESTTALRLYYNGVISGSVQTTSVTAATPSQPVYVGAYNAGGAAGSFLIATSALGAYAIDSGMTTAQMAAYYSHMQTFQTALSRNV